jgi:D-alanyl-lipoteichoic acid acyltransferase DltB (MBOAT superfamily)
MDVYRGDVYPEINFVRYALFVSFFPQLVAGPIERSKNLLKQLAVPKKFNFERAREGILLMIWGYFLKIVLADRIAVFVDTVYGDYITFSGWYIIIATFLFAIQIYCDFYGYSTIAMGTAKVLGIELMENFKTPYLACSVSEFWRNWHISLTSWFKDYLYIPLGGSRKGTARKNLNKMIVFLVSGLWHGADLSYVIWGGINGLYQIIGEGLNPVRKRIIKICHLHTDTFAHKLLRIIITFILIDFSWLFFRAASIQDALRMLASAFSANNLYVLFDGSIYSCGLDMANYILMLVSICILVFMDYLKYKGICVRNILIQQNNWFRWIFIAVCICLILLFGKWGPQFDKSSFIYFQF